MIVKEPTISRLTVSMTLTFTVVFAVVSCEMPCNLIKCSSEYVHLFPRCCGDISVAGFQPRANVQDYNPPESCGPCE